MKGNLLIAHGGGPTAVINASLAGVINEAKNHSAIDGIYGALHGIEGVFDEKFIELGNQPQDVVDRLPSTPGSAIGTCRRKLAEDDYPRLLDVFRRHNIAYFLYNGGNDSMDTCRKVSRLAADDELRVIGIPKTIDNDLAVTDHSPGYGSAARYLAVSVRELVRDIEALDIHVCIVESMGRNAGWLAAASVLARSRPEDGPRLIYLPERPFIEEEFLEDVDRLFKGGRGFVVAVSEGLARPDGTPVVRAVHDSAVDGFGHVLPGNVSHYLADLVSSRLGIRARSEKPGLLGRVSIAMQSDVDRNEAIEVGEVAVRAAVEGNSGCMVAIRRVANEPYRSELFLAPLDEVANVERTVPDEYITERGNDITPAFADYCRPLLGGPLPDYVRLDMHEVT